MTTPEKDLVVKYLIGEATPDEKQLVLEWICLSKENKEEFLEIQAMTDSILALKNPHNLNPKAAYTSLKKKMGKMKALHEESHFRKVPFFLKIASVFFAGFFISWLIHKTGNIDYEKISGIKQYQKVEVPYGSKTRLELPDGTLVILNSGSSLQYPLQFGEKTRSVFLSGEAYFEVKKDHNKPFFVNTAGIHIKVLGTSFNVKSYPEEKTVETTLITGAIEIFSDALKNDKKPVLLRPSQKATYIKEKPSSDALPVQNDKAEVLHVQKEENPQLFIAWKDNKLEFDNETFSDLCVKIERWYNVKIILNNDSVKNSRFSGKFDKENVEQAFKALAEVMPFHYQIEKDKIFIN